MYSCIKRFIAAFIAASFVFASGSNIYAQTVSMKLFYDGKSHNYSAEEVKIQVDGEGITGLDVPPIIINDRTMVPARAVFEKLGCDIAWNEEMQEVYVMHNTDLVILKIDSQTGTKNGESFTMDTPAKIVNDRTLIPIRAVSEAIGCDVKWDDGTRTVIVSSVKETAPPDSNSENNGGGQSSGEGNGTILDPEEGNSSSSGSSSSGGSNTNSNTNVSSKTIGITGISVPESIASEQKFYIRADGEIANYSSFILENNRLVVDITNADMKVSNTEIKNTNSSVVTSVRSAQNQTQPVKIARVVFDLSSLGDYEVKLSDDKKSIAVSFGISQVSNINTSSRGGADYINIYGDTSLSAEAYVEANPNRVVIDIHNAVSLLNSDYDASGLNFAQNIKTSQPDAKTVRITVDVSRTVEAEVINNGGYTSVCITRSTLDNVSYNSVSHTLTLLNAEELDDRGISHTDNYMGKTYRLTLNGDYSELYGTGTIKCNDDYLSTIKVGLDNNGNTYFEAAENRIVAVKTSDFSSTIEIKFVNPKEVYNKIVVIDAGHGKSDNGASGFGLLEKDVNLAIVQRLFKLLDNDPDIKVYATRLDDSYPTNASRAQMANEVADIFVSIHQNSNTSSTPHGTEVLYMNHANETGLSSSRLTSKTAAQIALTWVINTLGTTNRGVKERPDLIVLNQTTVPAILIETCFISNEADNSLIKNDEIIDNLAENIYKAINIMFTDYDVR